MHVVTIALAWLWLAIAPASAAPVDLSGTWILDRAASSDLDPLLEARGLSWVERKAAAGLEVTKTIQQDGDTLQIETVSKVKTQSETAQVDGQSRPVTTPKGETVQVTHRWEGTHHVVDSVMTNAKGQAVHITSTDMLSADGKTLTTRIQFQQGSSPPISVDRVFRRK